MSQAMRLSWLTTVCYACARPPFVLYVTFPPVPLQFPMASNMKPWMPPIVIPLHTPAASL